MTFAAKKDLWVACMLASIIVVAIGAGIFFIVMPGGNPASTGGGLVLLVLGLFFIWGFLGTTYEITSSQVIVRGGPLRHRIESLRSSKSSRRSAAGWYLEGHICVLPCLGTRS